MTTRQSSASLDERFDETPSYAALRMAESIGRPVGSPEWLADMEQRTGLKLAPGKHCRNQRLENRGIIRVSA